MGNLEIHRVCIVDGLGNGRTIRQDHILQISSCFHMGRCFSRMHLRYPPFCCQTLVI